MSQSTEKFAELLTEGVYRIRIIESKTIQILQDELGYAIGRDGGSAIEYWRKGHIPKLSEVENLAREIVKRGQLERAWLEQFLDSADHPAVNGLCDELFPAQVSSNNHHPAPSLIDVPEEIFPTYDGKLLPGDEFDPFIVGPPIIDPRYFFGRAYEINRIFGLWRRFPLQNVAVIGKRRSGKTSLLHYIKNIILADPGRLRPGQKSDWLPQPERYRWVFVDFQDARMCSRERLMRYLLTRLGMPVPNPCDLNNFLDTICEHLRRSTLLTLILMDEINAALASPELDQQFWGSLRSLCTNLTGGKLAFMLTSDELPARIALERGKPSPFFNIFGHTFQLKPFTESEARDLINSSPRPFSEADIEWLLSQSGRWPCLLQLLCHIRLTALEYGETGDDWKADGIRQLAPYWYLLSGS